MIDENPDKYKEKSVLLELYINQKLTTRAIAQIEGVHPSTIQYWLVRFGIPTRPRGSFKKGHTINKGRKRSEEYRKNISELRKGKTFTEEHKKHLSEAKKGKHPSKETRKKMSISRRGKSSHNKGKSSWNKGIPCPHEKKTRIAEALKGRFPGDKNPAWKGGISFEPYCPKFNHALKEKIRERDNRTCQLCEVKENGKKHDVHHVHYDKPNCDPDLVALCHICHLKVNKDRDYFEALFVQKLTERGLKKP